MARRTRPATIHSAAEFRARVLRFAAFGTGIVLASLVLGTIGYRWIAGLSWVDSFHSAAMILTGMGPVVEMVDSRSKLYDSIFAIYGGAVYPTVTAIVLYPLLHRMMNLLHVAALDEGTAPSDPESQP